VDIFGGGASCILTSRRTSVLITMTKIAYTKASYIFLLFVFIELTSCNLNNKPTLDCSSLKNGTFYIRSKIKGDAVAFKIERRDSLQTEIHNQTLNYSKLAVKWTGACTYETLVLESTLPFADSIQLIRKTIPIQFEIINVAKNYYVFKGHRGRSAVITDTLWLSEN
jgi:hypothetical protein